MEECPIYNPVPFINTNYKSVFSIYIFLSALSQFKKQFLYHKLPHRPPPPPTKNWGRNKA